MKRRILTILSIIVLGIVLFAGCGNNKMDAENTDASRQAAGESYKNEIMDEGAAYDDTAEIADAKSSGSAELTSNSSYDTNGSDTDSAGSADIQPIPTAPQNEKLIYTYHYSVETKKFDEFLQNAIQKAEQLGGYIQESETNGSSASVENRYARIVLRIPSDKKAQMLSMVQKESNVTYSNVTTDNVTLSYVDMQSHIQALRKEQSTLLNLIEKAQKVNDLIALQSQLTAVRYEIESYESQLRTMDNLITYSTIHLEISEVQRTTTVTGTKTSLGDEIKNKFSDNLYAVGEWLESLLVWFISSLPVLIPLAAVVILIYVFLRKRLRLKKSVQQNPAEHENSVHQDPAEQTQQDTSR